MLKAEKITVYLLAPIKKQIDILLELSSSKRAFERNRQVVAVIYLSYIMNLENKVHYSNTLTNIRQNEITWPRVFRRSIMATRPAAGHLGGLVLAGTTQV